MYELWGFSGVMVWGVVTAAIIAWDLIRRKRKTQEANV